MVKQGDIIKVEFSPQSGHEQAGYRPALIISNDFFNRKVNLVIACPITNTMRNYPLHIKLDERTKTTGAIMCEQMKALDINSRKYSFVETVPEDIMKNVIDIVFSEIETSL